MTADLDLENFVLRVHVVAEILESHLATECTIQNELVLTFENFRTTQTKKTKRWQEDDGNKSQKSAQYSIYHVNSPES